MTWPPIGQPIQLLPDRFFRVGIKEHSCLSLAKPDDNQVLTKLCALRRFLRNVPLPEPGDLRFHLRAAPCIVLPTAGNYRLPASRDDRWPLQRGRRWHFDALHQMRAGPVENHAARGDRLSPQGKLAVVDGKQLLQALCAREESRRIWGHSYATATVPDRVGGRLV